MHVHIQPHRAELAEKLVGQFVENEIRQIFVCLFF